MKTKFKLFCGAVALSLAGQAYAETQWVLTTAAATNPTGGFTTTVDGDKVIATGWADTGAGNPMILEQQNAPGNLRQYTGGLGINNLDGCGTQTDGTVVNCIGTTNDSGDLASLAPEHAIDNEARYEMVLLSFAQSVKLTKVNFGWVGTDSDYTILAYTPSAAPVLAGTTWGAVKTNSDWNKIGSYANAVAGADNSTNASVYSSYWLIGAYNPLAGTDNGYNSTSYDYVKLASVRGDICTNGSGPNCTPPGKVPEPGSLALVGFALMGMMGLRKRRQV